MKYSYPPDFHHDDVPALWQNPWEFRRTLDVIKGLKATSFLEIGTGYGLFARYLRRVRGMYVRSIDKAPMCEIQDPEVLFVGDSQIITSFEWAFSNAPKGGYDILYIDGGHTYKQCLDDHKLYSQLAKKAIMFHDIDGNQVGKYPVDLGPSEVWKEIKPKFNTIEIHANEPKNCGVGIILL